MVGLSPLTRVLWRDLWHHRGQAAAIMGVVAAGIATFVMFFSTFTSLDATVSAYYSRYRFADVFATAVRAPDALAARLAAVPGVATLDTRVEAEVVVAVAGADQPIGAHLVSLPSGRHPALDDVCVRTGAYPLPDHPDDVLVGEAFAKARGLGVGSPLSVIFDGHERQLRICGTALSPEYTYFMRPGSLLPDDAHYGILWMQLYAMAGAFDLAGAFNSVAVRLQPGASQRDVMDSLDRLLAPYGGTGAIARAQQSSHMMLSLKLEGQKVAGTIMPVIFLAVAAFLLDMVLARQVGMQREQIAVLVALGYSNLRVGWHYALWGFAISLSGAVAGIASGAALGRLLTQLYGTYFHFPELVFVVPGPTVVEALVVSVLATAFGVVRAVRAVVALPPAEAMRPEAPARFRESTLERLGLKRFTSPATRIVLRNLSRQPRRALVAVIGISLGTAMVVIGTFSGDAIDRVVQLQFDKVQRFDATVTFLRPLSARAADALDRLPGVLSVEGFRAVPVRLHAGPRFRLVALMGLPAAPRLNRVMDQETLIRLHLDPHGLAVSAELAKALGVGPGSTLDVEVLEGARPRRELVVNSVFQDYFGTNAYIEEGELHHLLGEDVCLSGAYLRLDTSREAALLARCSKLPAIAGIQLQSSFRKSWDETMAQGFRIQRGFSTVFSCIIAFGVVYNSARIILSERSRELATLRIIGFGPLAVSGILVGEIVLLTMVAIPLGLLLGYGGAVGMANAVGTEMLRLPATVAPMTYVAAALVVVMATAISAGIVARGLANLDLVAVLKTRE